MSAQDNPQGVPTTLLEEKKAGLLAARLAQEKTAAGLTKKLGLCV